MGKNMCLLKGVRVGKGRERVREGQGVQAAATTITLVFLRREIIIEEGRPKLLTIDLSYS